MGDRMNAYTIEKIIECTNKVKTENISEFFMNEWIYNF